MKEEFERYISVNGLAATDTKIILAVSGGIDSMVMAHLFISAGADIAIAHCNFNLRGQESDGDEEFVKSFAETNRVPFFRIGFDTSGFASEKGISIQMAARELRYRWFEELRSEKGYDVIALAHNLNDNVETFLINLSRGTGIAGLTGMKPVHGKLIRPLLFATRKAISDYAGNNGVVHREDRTNSDTKYTRNKIRHSLLPGFREINPSFDSTVSETAERLNEINEMVSELLKPLKEKIISRKDGLVHFRIKEIEGLSWKKALLFELFRPFGISSGQVAELVKLFEGRSGSQLITAGWRLIRSRSEIIAVPRFDESENYFELSGPDSFSRTGRLQAELIQTESGFRIPTDENTASIDYDKLNWPLVLRKNMPGDSFHPLGMKSRKKLSDYFIDKKYPVPVKEKKLVLESAGDIVWIIGDRLDDRFKITPETKNILFLRVSAPGSVDSPVDQKKVGESD
jgi:tRNA(Ile)-lysidine synthase